MPYHTYAKKKSVRQILRHVIAGQRKCTFVILMDSAKLSSVGFVPIYTPSGIG